MTWLSQVFWPAVWPNLAASLIWAAPTWALLVIHHVRVTRLMRRHHREQMRAP